tara:strand:+ start:506 stop:733 length:228 start_codon:yes stop_codon:yes gene_type:complete
MSKTDIYKKVIIDGSAVECNRLSLCCINDYLKFTSNRDIKYQVDCDDYRFKFSKLYGDINDAVEKYVEIKGKLYK